MMRWYSRTLLEPLGLRSVLLLNEMLQSKPLVDVTRHYFIDNPGPLVI